MNNEYANEDYQPMYAYIPELDEILEYNFMSDSKEKGENYMKTSSAKWEFIGYGFQVYTYTKTNWTNPVLAVGQFQETKALFKKVR